MTANASKRVCFMFAFYLTFQKVQLRHNEGRPLFPFLWSECVRRKSVKDLGGFHKRLR